MRKWLRQSEVDAGDRPGVTTNESEELKRLRRENAELRRANEILKTASAFSQRSSTAPGRDDPLRRRAQDEADHRRGPVRATAAGPGQRQFRAPAPNRLWVTDITYIRTWHGWAFLALVVDAYSRRIVGWALTTHLRTELALEALKMAIWARDDLDGLVHHSDRGSQYTAIRYTDTLAGVHTVASVGSRGDNYDNALAASTMGQIKTELIHRRGPWRTVEQLEYAVFEFLDWWNHRRLHGEIGLVPPAELEHHYYSQQHPVPEATTL